MVVAMGVAMVVAWRVLEAKTAHVALLLARSAQLAVSAAAEEDLGRELCRMSVAVKGSTYKKRRTNTWVAEAISMLSVPGETSHASLRVAVF